MPPKLINCRCRVIDPEELVWLIALPLIRDVEEDISRGMCNFAQAEIKHCFSEILANLNRLSELLETWGKPVRIDVRERNLKDLDFFQLALIQKVVNL
jgi:hypothetical protein